MSTTVDRTVYAIRHVPFEDLGTLEPVFVEHDFEVRYLEAGIDDLQQLEPKLSDVVVFLGGPIGAYQEDAYPFLAQERALAERCLERDQAVVGICLGAQIMARALGAKVYPGERPEIGWAPITLSEEGRHSWLAPLEETEAVFHWHGDTFDLPAGARHLASTEICRNQAFSWGSHALALQFHPEVISRDLERWYIGHSHELNATEGVTVHGLRRDAERYGAHLQQTAGQCWHSWLKSFLSREVR